MRKYISNGKRRSNYITYKKIRTILISDKKGPKIKPSEIFKRPKFKSPKILRYSKTTLVSRNKPDLIRKDLEMLGIVKAVTKELEPEDPFKIHVVD